MVNHGVILGWVAAILLGIWVIEVIWVKAHPPTPKPRGDPLPGQHLEPTRVGEKRHRDGSTTLIRVYRSDDTGRVYRRTTTKRPTE